jgi:glycosyltransferase 2 family protein
MGTCRRESGDGVIAVGKLKTASEADSVTSAAQTTIPKIGRSRISVTISLLMLAVAAFALYFLLRDVDVDKVVDALRAQSVQKIAIAGAFVVAGYVTLTFYDVFALRTIGHGRVPYPVAALASFTSSTIGHSLGAAVLTGGLVRLRIYSAWGLTAIDIAKIAVITGMTFWLGNAFLLGGAIVYAPEAASAVDQMPSWINRTIGLAGLLALACYLLWLAPRQRAIGRSSWRLVLPGLRATLLQIGIGVADLSLVALAMYTLLPATPAVAFDTVLVVFLTSVFLGTVSHAPGGLGIIEATMLFGLRQFQKEELLAALLTFRVLYFVLPLLVAALSLGLRELQVLARGASAARDPST